MEDWARSLSESVGTATGHASYRILRAVLSFAVRRGYLAHNPAQALRISGVKPRKAPDLSPETIQDIAEAIEPRYSAMVLTMALAGLRIGEVTALSVEDSDEIRGELVVNKAFAEVDGKPVLGPTKTGEERKIALPGVIVQAIAEHLKSYGPGTDGLIFSASRGGPIWPDHFRRRAWATALRKAGVGYVSPHNLRHFAVSFALGTGAKITEAAELAGHSDPMTTSRVYSHSLPGVARRVADDVSAAYEKATSGGSTDSEVVSFASTGEAGNAGST